MQRIVQITIDLADDNKRIDKVLSEKLPDFSRSMLQKVINEGNVLLDDVVIRKQNQIVKIGQVIDITLVINDCTTKLLPCNDIKLDIVYEDDALLVVNKPAGLTVHPGAGNYSDTLANALVVHCADNLSSIGGIMRPGIVHRLDKDTSGLMVIAKNDTVHYVLSKAIANKEIQRKYYAIIWGVPKASTGTMQDYIGRSTRDRTKMAVSSVEGRGKLAVTHYRLIEVYKAGLASMVECELATGRTHQIRVQWSHRGHGLVGDPVYGCNKRTTARTEDLRFFLRNFKRQALHSYYLELTHPVHNNVMHFQNTPPSDMMHLINLLR